MRDESEGQEHHSLQHDAEHERPRKKHSVMSYLAILFAAAFLLLLMSYFMQQRASEEAFNSLQQTSNSAVQSLDNLIAERDELKEKVGELERQLTELGGDNDSLRSTAESQTEWLAKNREAMDWFWQLDEAYVLGKYSLCRSIIQTMEDAAHADPLKSYLPAESTTDNDRFSPAERYQEIYDTLY